MGGMRQKNSYLAGDDDVVFDIDDGDNGAVGIDFVTENSHVMLIDYAEVEGSTQRRSTQPGQVKKSP